jgi:hypothetical protein
MVAVHQILQGVQSPWIRSTGRITTFDFKGTKL